MSLRKLPEVQAFERPKGLSWEPDEAAIERWRPEVRAAAEDGATISIYEDIGYAPWTGGGMTAKRVAGLLRSFGEVPVTVNVNSPGGDFFEGIAIYSLLRDHKAEVTVRVMALAASAASVIAMAGDRVLISEAGFVMVHNAWACACGDRLAFRELADTLEPFDSAMAGIYAARSGKTRAEAAAWMDKTTWMGAETAIENGMADDLIPWDQVTEDNTKETRARSALKVMDTALARQNMPRSERRALLGQLRGAQPAAPPATHDAGAIAAFRRLADTIQS